MSDSLDDLPTTNAPMDASEYARAAPYISKAAVTNEAGQINRPKFYLIVGAIFAVLTFPLIDALLGKLMSSYALWGIKIAIFLVTLFILARVNVL